MGWVFLLLIEGIAVFCDIHTGKIPNPLIVGGLILGFSWQFCDKELYGISVFFFGTITVITLLGILHYFKMLGAGDIKLFMVAGGFLGTADVMKLIVISFLIAAGLSMRILVRHRILRQRLSYFIQYIRNLYSTGKWEPYIKNEKNAAYLHFSVPVFLGSIILRGGFI